MNLSLFVIAPLVTVLAILFCRGQNAIRWVSLAGVTVQLFLSFILLRRFWQERAGAFSPPMLFTYRYHWFRHLHIDYYVGVDGISVGMILLTAVVMVGAVLVSWKIAFRVKEFFVLLLLLSAGAYGFFIS